MPLIARSPWLLLLILFLSTPPTRGQARTEVLTNCLDVLKLSPGEASENRRVRVRGIATCYIPESQLFFIQDETAGIYVLPNPWPKDLIAGDVVEVEGNTASGRFSPIIQIGNVRRTGERKTPVPIKIGIEELNSGRFDCQWVQVEGVLQQITSSDNISTLKLRSGDSSASALLFGSGPVDRALIDARLRVTGVGGSLYEGERLKGFGVFSATPAQILVVNPAPSIPSLPLRQVKKLAWYSPYGAMDHRIRLQGTVVAAWPGESLFLRDETGTIAVNGEFTVKPGDLVEVAGFIRDANNKPYLDHSSVRMLGHATVPAPRTVDLNPRVLSESDPELVSVQADVLKVRTEERGFSVLTLGSEKESAPAFVRGAVSTNLEGARIRLTGVWSSARVAGKNGRASGMQIESVRDITILSASPRSTTQSHTSSLLAGGIGAAAALILGSVSWRARLRARRLIKENQQIYGRFQSREKEFLQLTEARESLSRNLHDHIMQSIYAVGLNVEDCSHILEKEPATAQARLRTALAELNSVIRELRNVILGLESGVIQPQEFRAALKSLAVALGEKIPQIRLDLDEGTIHALTSNQATEMIHVAREALSNSIRHGQAQTTTFALKRTESGIQFSIEDDGQGFQSEMKEGTGFGLRNISRRAEGLGGTLNVHSELGQGTRIVLDIPAQMQHLNTNDARSRINR